MLYCMPPDPNPHKPQCTPPPKSCDTHFHVFGPPEKFPFAPTRQYTPPAAPLEHYLHMLAVIGIERAVVVQPSVHGLDNTVTLDAIARTNGRFRGVARVDDKVSRAGALVNETMVCRYSEEFDIALQRHYGLGEEPRQFFIVHSKVDKEHTALAAEAIARFANSPRDQFLVREAARNMARFKVAKFEGIYKAYS